MTRRGPRATLRCVASELVTNSLTHTASETVSVHLRAAGDAIRIEVVDEGARAPGPELGGPPDSDELERGRGLYVVAALTGGRWGTWTGGAYRTTWAEIACGQCGGA